MKKFFVIAILTFYTLGQVFLPKGNFAYIEQLPNLYADFCKTNPTANIFDFFDEQFLDTAFGAYEDDEKEPYEENDAKSVPFHTVYQEVPLVVVQSTNTDLKNFPQTKSQHNSIYILKDYWVHTSSIYHPPKTQVA